MYIKNLEKTVSEVNTSKSHHAYRDLSTSEDSNCQISQDEDQTKI